MNAADWIAVYGAIVATAVAAWQIVAYWQGHRPRLAVSSECMLYIEDEEAVRRYAGTLAGRGGDQAPPLMIKVRLANLGHVRAQVSSLMLRQVDGGSPRQWDASEWAELPLWIEPGEAVLFSLTEMELLGLVLAEPLRISVKLSTGNEFTHTVPALISQTADNFHVVVGLPLYQKLLKHAPVPPRTVETHILERGGLPGSIEG